MRIPQSLRLKRHLLLGLTLLAASSFAPAALGLTPDQVAVIVNGLSPGSRQVAEYYAKVRHIPADHLITISLDVGEDLPQMVYEARVADPIRKALRDRKLDKTVTCLVTTFDVPLRVGHQPLTAGDEKLIQALRKEMVQAMEEMQETISLYNTILPATTQPAVASPSATEPASRARQPELPPLPKLLEQLQAAINSAGMRINKTSGPAKDAAAERFLQLQEKMLGWAGVATTFHMDSASGPGQRVPVDMQTLATRVQHADRRIRELSANGEDPATHEEMIKLLHDSHGQVAVSQRLENDLAVLQHTDSEAALDSELMTLWVENYPHARWLNNPTCVMTWPNLPTHQGIPMVLMVTRLDGATVQKTIAMIDTSLRVEQKGLDGVIYLDARGNHTGDNYGKYDDDIRTAAAYLRENTDMKVVLDDKPALLEAKDCPNAALYCGWYQLRDYHDSCQWLPGAVGYHVASLEMVSLHNPGEKGWAVNLLSRGLCGTLGATSEPYLHSFPPPSLFFPLLLSGQYTQAEVYRLTCPLLSWRISYLGDPLYNPFKARPRITSAQLQAHPVLRHAAEILPPDKSPPTTVPSH